MPARRPTLESALRSAFRLDLSALDFGIYRLIGLRRESLEAFVQHTLARARTPELEARLVDWLGALDDPPPPMPADGVLFGWRHAEALLVRCAELHRDLTLPLPPRGDLERPRLALRVAEAEFERASNKAAAQRRFLLHEARPLELVDQTLTLWLAYRVPQPGATRQPGQAELNAATEARILSLLPEPWRALMAPMGPGRGALGALLARATRRESVDLFLRPKLRRALDDSLARACATKEPLDADFQAIARDIADRLVAEETLALQLFLKRRFVLRSDAASPPAPATTLYWGTNLDALRLAEAGLRGKVQAIYIDPPYNTGDGGFVYKDRFQHDSWLTLLRQALEAARPLASRTGMLAISINESELAHLLMLCRQLFGESAFTGLFTVRVRHEDRILKGDKETHEVTEFVVVYKLGEDALAEGRRVSTDDAEAYRWWVETSAPPLRGELRGGKQVEVFGPGDFTLREAPGGLKRINIRGSLRRANSSGRFYVAHIEPDKERLRGHLLRVADMGADGLGARYFWVPPDDGKRNNPDYFQGVPLKQAPERRVPYPNFVDFEVPFNKVAGEGGVSFRDGKKPLAFLDHFLTLCGVAARRDAIVLDFFAGSGSTAHAVMAMNARDGGHRRAVLAEMGEYLPTVTVPRLRNAAQAAIRQGLDPESATHRVIELESFDDVLESYAAPERPDGLRYLPGPTGPRLGLIHRPARATLRVRTREGAREAPVDLPATFALLLGLEETQLSAPAEGLTVQRGRTPQRQAVRALWRDTTLWPDDRILATYPLNDGETTYVNGGVSGPGLRSIEETLQRRMFEP